MVSNCHCTEDSAARIGQGRTCSYGKTVIEGTHCTIDGYTCAYGCKSTCIQGSHATDSASSSNVQTSGGHCKGSTTATNRHCPSTGTGINISREVRASIQAGSSTSNGKTVIEGTHCTIDGYTCAYGCKSTCIQGSHATDSASSSNVQTSGGHCKGSTTATNRHCPSTGTGINISREVRASIQAGSSTSNGKT